MYIFNIKQQKYIYYKEVKTSAIKSNQIIFLIHFHNWYYFFLLVKHHPKRMVIKKLRSYQKSITAFKPSVTFNPINIIHISCNILHKLNNLYFTVSIRLRSCSIPIGNYKFCNPNGVIKNFMNFFISLFTKLNTLDSP